MQLKADQLLHHLASNLLPVYVICGDEPFLVQEASENIRKAALGKDFSERKLFDGEDTEFDHLSSGMETMSLFAERTLYEYRLDKLPSANAGKQLQAWCEQPEHDDMLLISMPKVDKRTRQKAWFKAIDAIGCHISVFPVSYRDFPGWLNRRAQGMNVQLSPEALSILTERTEGNLLAANQEIERLALLSQADNVIDEQALREFTADNARFGQFEMIDTCLSGHASRTVRMLHSLRQEGTHIMEITGALNMEIRKLCRIAWGREQGESLSQLYRSFFIWQSKQAVYNQAINRYPLKVWHQILSRCLVVDKCIKGQVTADDWLALETLLLVIAGERSFGKALPLAS